ncbi:MAG: hypothetical protein V1736_11650, partial [Pseudomonadota bacterium]
FNFFYFSIQYQESKNRHGLRMANFLDLRWKLSSDLGVTFQFGNPITVYQTLIESMVDDPNVDALHCQIHERFLMLPKDFFKIFHRAPEACKPLVLWVVGMQPGVHETLEWLEEYHIPVFPSPEKAINALAALHRVSQTREPQT